MTKPNEEELFNKIRQFCSDFPLSIHDIKNPSPGFVQEMYKRMLIEFNVDIPSLTQPNIRQMELYQPYSEMFHDIVPVVNLLSALKYFRVIPNIGLMDLTSPEPKRNLEQMTAFINFLEFADQKLTELEDMFERIKAMKDHEENLKLKIDQLKEIINNRAMMRSNLLMERPELEKKYKTLLDEQKIASSEKELICEELGKVETLHNEKIRNVEKIKEQLEALETDMNGMKAQVVDSPTAVVQEMDTLVKKKEEWEEDLENVKDKLQSKKQLVAQLSDMLSKQERRMEELTELIALIYEVQEKQKSVEANMKTIDDTTAKRQEGQLRFKKMQNKIDSLKKELSTSQSQWKSEEHLLLEELESLKSECGELKRQSEDAVERKRQLEEVKQIIEMKIKECHNFVDDSDTKYTEMMTEARQNHLTAYQALGKIINKE